MGSLSEPRPMSLMPLICLILLCLTPFPATPVADNDTLTAFEALQQYDFPEGIIPKSIVGYDLDRSTGKFSAYFNGSCSFSLVNSYQLNYQPTITGYISKDKLTKLQGVSVKVFLFWINIVEVVRTGQELEFSVGIASASYPIENFLESPQCGCGFECDDKLSKGNEWNLLVSSA